MNCPSVLVQNTWGVDLNFEGYFNMGINVVAEVGDLAGV